jgi:plasmid stabilization system protein ParE
MEPPKPISIDPWALDEVKDAYDWYLKADPQAASRFQAELERCLQRIQERPQLFPPYLEGTRRCVMRTFPYLVVYREYADHIFIAAVAHQKRKPGYWMNRD